MNRKRTPARVRAAAYPGLLAELKSRVHAAQVRAAVSVNRELIRLYWHLGRQILDAQRAQGWGGKIVARLPRDLAAAFPELGGFSERNLNYMLAFAEAWVPAPILQRPVAKSGAAGPDGPPEPLSRLTWSANLILLQRLKEPATRLWYVRRAAKHGWSRAVLGLQIGSRLHERSGRAITNFAATLPPAQSDLAGELLKDPYTFDFLTLGPDARNRLKVEYALRDVRQPIGVAEWQTRLVQSLPRNLRGSLPAIADLERQLGPLRRPARQPVSPSRRPRP
jgi:predicted nuclease of restriction endonuclease-like (RecB) superfamily